MTSLRDLVKEASLNGGCYKHPIYSIIETADNETYLLGWNGPDTLEDHPSCLRQDYRSGEGRELCPGTHSELRIIRQAREKKVDLKGATLYMDNFFPCVDCTREIISAGIAKVVTGSRVYANRETFLLEESLRKQSYDFEESERLLREAGISIEDNVFFDYIHPADSVDRR